MAVEILLPKTGVAVNEGLVAAWHAADGAAVIEGESLFALDAGGSTNDVEAPASGTLRIITRTGETYSVGTVLGYIEPA